MWDDKLDDNLVLVSWIATNNDPFGSRDGEWGPTLTLLFDPDSPCRGKVKDAVFFRRQPGAGQEDSLEAHALKATEREIRRKDHTIQVHDRVWHGDDPTEHKAIFDFMRRELPHVREAFAGRTLVIHTSPGTPSMQTIWVLMGETGYIEPPFVLVKSFRKEHRRGGRPPVLPVEVGVETFYKHYIVSRPERTTSEDQQVLWDPKEFRAARMKSLFQEARRFAHLAVPVLLLGERGTGKTTLAGWIRTHSPACKPELDRHWPAVPCGQYVPETMRAELFGYVKGAFTGATHDHDGLLALADGDTLFLD